MTLYRCKCLVVEYCRPIGLGLVTFTRAFKSQPDHLQAALSSDQLNLLPSAGREMSSSLRAAGWRPSMADWSSRICVLHGAGLFAISRNGNCKLPLGGLQIRGSLQLVQQWNDVFEGWTLFWSPYKVFCSFCFCEGRWSRIWMMPPSSLSVLSNMQIKAAIIEIPYFGHNSIQRWDKRMKMVSIPRFSGSVVLIGHFEIIKQFAYA